MPKVLLSGSACQRFTGGKTELEVDATTFRRLVVELEQRFPGLGKQVEDSMAVAIDGEDRRRDAHTRGAAAGERDRADARRLRGVGRRTCVGCWVAILFRLERGNRDLAVAIWRSRHCARQWLSRFDRPLIQKITGGERCEHEGLTDFCPGSDRLRIIWLIR